MGVLLPGLGATFAMAVCVMMGLLFLIAAVGKLRSIGEFRETLANYRLLPEAAVVPVAVLLPLTELTVGAALLPGFRLALVPAIGLLLLFSGAVAVNLRRGRTQIDCGCGGADGRQPISWALVWHDLALAGLAALAFASPHAAIGAYALGGCLILGLTLFLLDMTFDRIIAIGALYPGGRRAPVAWTQI